MTGEPRDPDVAEDDARAPVEPILEAASEPVESAEGEPEQGEEQDQAWDPPVVYELSEAEWSYLRSGLDGTGDAAASLESAGFADAGGTPTDALADLLATVERATSVVCTARHVAGGRDLRTIYLDETRAVEVHVPIEGVVCVEAVDLPSMPMHALAAAGLAERPHVDHPGVPVRAAPELGEEGDGWEVGAGDQPVPQELAAALEAAELNEVLVSAGALDEAVEGQTISWIDAADGGNWLLVDDAGTGDEPGRLWLRPTTSAQIASLVLEAVPDPAGLPTDFD